MQKDSEKIWKQAVLRSFSEPACSETRKNRSKIECKSELAYLPHIYFCNLALESLSTEKPLELTMEYVLTRIDQIMKDTEHIYKATLSNVIPEICIWNILYRHSKSLAAFSILSIILTLKGHFASQFPQAMHSDALWELAWYCSRIWAGILFSSKAATSSNFIMAAMSICEGHGRQWLQYMHFAFKLPLKLWTALL